MLTTSAQKVHKWLNETGLELALHKCEAMIITKTRSNNEMNISINGHKVETKGHMKYLGVHLDSKWSFSAHAKEASAKASKVAQNLSRIMPNISAAKWRKRTLYSNIVHSILLYGAPIWAHDMSASGWEHMKRVQRRICLRTASAYCTVSGDAIAVITGVAPLDITAKDRSDEYNNRRNPENTRAIEDPTSTWQRRWDESTKGRWTHELITDIKTWTQRKHGEINFHLTQVLSGHGCFSKYLKKYAKLESEECWYCGHPTDDAYHTMFVCDAWHRLRNEAETYLEIRLTPGNMVSTMLSSKRNWHIVDELVHKIMSHKEIEERRRQALPALTT
uniref:Retrovirus-related Pol polyprotein from type-1 retrotransposable element R1 2 n=1 Tax=Schizaphis graminum TaxID=13262 RepID=A0A2S2PDK9_SCHGA